MTIDRYRVTIKHDGGTIRLTVPAGSADAARRIVMKAESCPARAIRTVRKVK